MAVGNEIIFDHNNPNDMILFWATFSTSILTSSLGLAKSLKTGPCRILPEQKRLLGGLLSPRFILIFFSCGFTLFAKGWALALLFLEGDCLEEGAIALSTIFLPSFLIGLFACWHKGILKTFLTHPSVFLLPVFSFFTFASNSKVSCRGGTDVDEKGDNGEKEETIITFSLKYTAINTGVSVLGFPAYAILYYTLHITEFTDEPPNFILQILFLVSLPWIPGLLLSLTVTFSNQCNYCKSCYCCSCCIEPFEFGALLISLPQSPCVLGSDGQLPRVESDGGLEQEQTESMVVETEVKTMEEEVENIVEEMEVKIMEEDVE